MHFLGRVSMRARDRLAAVALGLAVGLCCLGLAPAPVPAASAGPGGPLLLPAISLAAVTGAQTGAQTGAPAEMTLLSARPSVSADKVELKLGCGRATCRGTLTLSDGRTVLASSRYAMLAGTTESLPVSLRSQALVLLVDARYHTLAATETVTVDGGGTVQRQLALVGPSVVLLTPTAVVTGGRARLRLGCGAATCRGTIWLNYGRPSLGSVSYAMLAGTSSTWTAELNTEALRLLAHSRDHLLNATETVTVGDGPTVYGRVTLLG